MQMDLISHFMGETLTSPLSNIPTLRTASLELWENVEAS